MPRCCASTRDLAGLRRVQVRVPLVPTGLVSRLAPVLTRAPASTVQTLVESLHHDMVCGDQDFLRDLMPERHPMLPVAEAIDRALARPGESVPDQDRDVVGPLRSDAGWAGGQVSRHARASRPPSAGRLAGPAAGPATALTAAGLAVRRLAPDAVSPDAP